MKDEREWYGQGVRAQARYLVGVRKLLPGRGATVTPDLLQKLSNALGQKGEQLSYILMCSPPPASLQRQALGMGGSCHLAHAEPEGV